MYGGSMSRVTVDVDDQACTRVMRQNGFATQEEAINFALRQVAVEPLTLEEARALEGSGWDGNLDEMRSSEGRIL